VIQKLIDKYCRLLSWLMVASLALMVVLVFTNVVLRYAMNSGISVSEELSRWLFVWLTFLGELGAMTLGIPIAFSLLLCGAALMWHMNMFDAQILAQNVINGADSFSLLAVPFFMLAGEVMNTGGLSRRIVDFAMALVGHITPVGTVLNVVAGVGKMRMDDVTRGVMPFMLVQFAVMFLMVLFPQIIMWPARLLYP